MELIFLKIKRQNGPEENSYWQEFRLPMPKDGSVISALRLLGARPVDLHGKNTVGVVYQANCLEGECGSCAMIINGVPKLACQVSLKDLPQPIVVEPLSRFPVQRDLVVDRSRIQEDNQKIQSWVSVSTIQAPYTKNTKTPSPTSSSLLKSLSQCIDCGLCLEACPAYHHDLPFMGSAMISKARLFHLLEGRSSQRLTALMDVGGVEDCGHAQNCHQVCPKEIPLLTSIGKMEREVLKEGVRRVFG